jgi:hypothetical protein
MSLEVVEVISERPDPWFGNDQLLLCVDTELNFWFVHNNDAYPKDHPDYMKVLYKVRPVKETKVRWERIKE